MKGFSWQPFDVAGLHYAIRILLGSAIAWFVVGQFHEVNALWAVIAMVSVTEPQMATALVSFRAQAFNTMIGCAIGLSFIALFGVHAWLLPIAATLAAMASIHFFRMSQGWRTAPITAALVLSAGISGESAHNAMTLATGRALGVFTGSVVALLVTLTMSRLWMPPEVKQNGTSAFGK